MLLADISKEFIVIAVFIVFFVAWKKAGGTFSTAHLNIISASFYLVLITALIGGSAIYLGFRGHYIAAKVDDYTANKGYWILAYSVVALPLLIIVFNRVLGIKDYKKFYTDYIAAPIDTNNEYFDPYIVVLVLTIICTVACIYTFRKVGYIALFEMLKGTSDSVNEAASSRSFGGSVLFKNVIALGLTPILSYMAYIYYLDKKENRWRFLFYFLFFLAVLVKTYDFSKAPIVIYIFYYYLINVMLGKVGDQKKIIPFLVLAGIIIICLYRFVLGYSGKLLSLTNGPLSRLMMSQIGGLFMHVKIFPTQYPYLRGTSFSRSIARLMHLQNYGVRSGRVVMSILYPERVTSNTVGVMNTLFVAEAYANYGIPGVFISPLIVAFCISFIPNVMLIQRKTPLNITLYVFMTYCYNQALIGGFVDFVYNALLIAIVLIMVFAQVLIRRGRLTIRMLK